MQKIKPKLNKVDDKENENKQGEVQIILLSFWYFVIILETKY